MGRILVLGSSNTDMTVRLDRLPAPGETVLGGAFGQGPGGKGANQAVAAARAGGDVAFVTAVGDDAFGRAAVAGYRAEGIDVRHVRSLSGVASGVALILVGESGENLIGVAPGANARLTPDDVAGLPEGLFTPDGLLLVAGLEIPPETASAAVRRAIKSGMPVVLNPAPAADGLAEAGVLDAVGVVTPNRGELGRLTGRDTATERATEQAARELRKAGPGAVVVTLGSDGCLVLDDRGPVRIPAIEVEPVDTVGAGDAFSAALAVALSEGRDLAEAAGWATAAAALAVTRPGAQGALPRRPQIDSLFEQTRARR